MTAVRGRRSTKMDHQGDRSIKEHAASTPPVASSMRAITAHDTDATVDFVVFDDALSFLDSLDDLNRSVDVLLHDDASYLEPVSTPYVPEQTPQVPPSVSSASAVGTSGGTDLQKAETSTVSRGSPKHVQSPSPPAFPKDRQKQEIKYLRSQVMELEAELAALKTSPNSSPNALAESSAWEKIAQRQNEAKQQSAIENTKLRELLEGQLKVARSLEKLLNKRVLSAPNEGFTERKRTRVTHVLDASASIDKIRGRIRSLFDDVDTVMDECGLSVVYTDLDGVHAAARATTDNAICIEMIVAKVYPFSVKQVEDAMWQCTVASHIELHNGHFGGSQRSDDLCDINFVLEMQLRRTEALVRAHGVAARRGEANRSVIVSETSGMTEGKLFVQDPIHCRERGYVTIEKNPMCGDSVASPSTLVRICACIWPECTQGSGKKAGKSPRVESFIDLLIGSYNQNTKTMLQFVENVLVEQSLKQAETVDGG